MLSSITASPFNAAEGQPRRGLIFTALEESQSRKYGTFETIRKSFDKLNIFGFCVIVGQEYAVMLHRFQKFERQLEPGINFKIPFVDTVGDVHDLREQVIEIPPQMCVTKDNVSI